MKTYAARDNRGRRDQAFRIVPIDDRWHVLAVDFTPSQSGPGIKVYRFTGALEGYPTEHIAFKGRVENDRRQG
jgi:hypothetical protein